MFRPGRLSLRLGAVEADARLPRHAYRPDMARHLRGARRRPCAKMAAGLNVSFCHGSNRVYSRKWPARRLPLHHTNDAHFSSRFACGHRRRPSAPADILPLNSARGASDLGRQQTSWRIGREACGDNRRCATLATHRRPGGNRLASADSSIMRAITKLGIRPTCLPLGVIS